jgi:hypothetical protein
MAAPVIGPYVDRVEGGKRITTVTIAQDVTTTTTTEYSIAVPPFCTVTLVESDLLGAGTAATIQPAFGVVTGWTIGGPDHVDQAAAADANHRIADNKRVTARSTRLLYVLSAPDANLDGTQTISTRITFEYGHK